MKIGFKSHPFKFDRKFLLYFLSLFLIFFLMLSCRWIYHNFHRVNFDEIGIVLNSGISGADTGLFWSFIKKSLLRSLMWTTLVAVFVNFFRHNKKIVLLTYILLLGMLYQKIIISNVQFGSVFNMTKSDFYETEYVNPESANISWPEHKNVLFIALESMEKVYNSDNVFGEVLTPNIASLEKQNVSFEQYHSISGFSHTIAAITGFTTGLPLYYTSYSNVEKMVGAYGIGTIFKNAGYQTWSMFPATGKFSRKQGLMQRMGFDNVIDGETIRSQIKNPPKEAPFHGIDDGTFFDWTKEKIKNIVKSKQPYFIFLETINTHCSGYFTEYCEKLGFEQKTAQDIVKCDDKIIFDFVTWFRKTDPNAVVILINDHAQHAGPIMEKLNNVADRSLSNVFINTNIFKGVDTSRPVSAMDFFPTIIESAGAKIKGCKLGLGTSLSNRCKDVKTMRERFSDKELENKMEQKNDLYYKLATGREKK